MKDESGRLNDLNCICDHRVTFATLIVREAFKKKTEKSDMVHIWV